MSCDRVPRFPRSRILVMAVVVALAVAPARGDTKPAPDPAAPLKIHIIGAGEYDPMTSLPEFKTHLEKHYRVACTMSLGDKGTPSSLENLDELKSADLLLLFARRMKLPESQMAIIRAHWEAGKPIVGLRTACHAFQKADNEIFDRKVLGGNYGNGPSSNGAYTAVPAEGAADHPILKGVEPFRANKYIYGQGPLAAGVVVLQICDSPKNGKLPATWVHEYHGGRMFYSSTGAPDDFQDENFRRMLTNAIFWTSHRDPEQMKKPGE
ncbi:MAG: ThuA domain-containing protein [Planctomycetales bacterium]